MLKFNRMGEAIPTILPLEWEFFLNNFDKNFIQTGPLAAKFYLFHQTGCHFVAKMIISEYKYFICML